MLGNPLLAQVGALIGFSGAILTWIMCEAMGRDIVSVILGGAGTSAAPAAIEGAEIEGEATICDIDTTVEKLLEAKNIMIVPGYGLAVAQAQFAVAEIAKKLRDKGKNIRFGYVKLFAFIFETLSFVKRFCIDSHTEFNYCLTFRIHPVAGMSLTLFVLFLFVTFIMFNLSKL